MRIGDVRFRKSKFGQLSSFTQFTLLSYATIKYCVFWVFLSTLTKYYSYWRIVMSAAVVSIVSTVSLMHHGPSHQCPHWDTLTLGQEQWQEIVSPCSPGAGGVKATETSRIMRQPWPLLLGKRNFTTHNCHCGQNIIDDSTAFHESFR